MERLARFKHTILRTGRAFEEARRQGRLNRTLTDEASASERLSAALALLRAVEEGNRKNAIYQYNRYPALHTLVTLYDLQMGGPPDRPSEIMSLT